jgi:hypothetical protein
VLFLFGCGGCGGGGGLRAGVVVKGVIIVVAASSDDPGTRDDNGVVAVLPMVALDKGDPMQATVGAVMTDRSSGADALAALIDA